MEKNQAQKKETGSVLNPGSMAPSLDMETQEELRFIHNEEGTLPHDNLSEQIKKGLQSWAEAESGQESNSNPHETSAL